MARRDPGEHDPAHQLLRLLTTETFHNRQAICRLGEDVKECKALLRQLVQATGRAPALVNGKQCRPPPPAPRMARGDAGDD